MNRRLIAAIALIGCLRPVLAGAQTEQVLYYHTDAIGSVRMITDANGQVVERHDFLPFGQEYLPPQSSTERRLYTSKEHDSETALDYLGSRYYASGIGRFTTVDPYGIDPMRLVNPQRMNVYAYAINNPLTHVDPDGRDSIIVNFSTGAPISGHTFGHNGIISVHQDGSLIFADFGPVPDAAGRIQAPGLVNQVTDMPRIAFGSSGLPTRASFLALVATLAKKTGRPPESIRLAYFKSSEADTAKLDAFIASTYKATQPGGNGLPYNVLTQSCGMYALCGLAISQGNAPPSSGFSLPNFDFLYLALFARTTFQVTTTESYCLKTEAGC